MTNNHTHDNLSQYLESYMLPDMHVYHQHQQQHEARHSSDALDVESNKLISSEPQRSEDNHPVTEAAHDNKYLMAEEMFEGKGDVMCGHGIQSAETFIPVYAESMAKASCKVEGSGRQKKVSALIFIFAAYFFSLSVGS